MILDPAKAKVLEIAVTTEAVPEQTADGPIVWATVDIEYALGSMVPRLSVRVPISPCESAEANNRAALLAARSLIHHACAAPGLAAPADDSRSEPEEAGVLEGLAQELGLTQPTTQPRQRTHG